MKKVYIGILAVLYLAVTSGVALELHYCMGDKAGMDLYGAAGETCGKCGMTEKNTGCCHDEFKFFKISDSHKTVSNDIDLSASCTAVFSDYCIYNWQMPDRTVLHAVNNHAPPDPGGPSACILNCIFRI